MNILKSLNSPVPVAWFQYLCGVRWKNPDPRKAIFPVEKASTSKDAVETSNTQDFYLSNKILFFLAKSGSELVGEPFYSVFFPACAWLFDVTVARRTLIVLATSMYVGQALKNFLKQPIPASPPVIRLDTWKEGEYGMPSTHTIAGVTTSFSLLIFASERYQVPYVTGAGLATVWSATVMISRTYLGMHNILETTTGAMLSFLILCLHPVVAWLEEAHMKSSSLTSVAIGVGSLLLARILFLLDNDADQPYNTSRNDAVEILGWCSGFLIGSKYSIGRNVLAEMSPNISHAAGARYSVLLCSTRFTAGAIVLAPVSLLLRKLLLRLLIRMHGFNDIGFDEAKRKCPIQLPYKFFTAFLSALISTTVVPTLLQSLQLW